MLASNEAKLTLVTPSEVTQLDARKRLDEEIKARAEIEFAVTNWADFWSAQDVDKYLKAYSVALVLPPKLTRSQWIASRKERLSKPEFIEVSLSNMVIVFDSDDDAIVDFIQKYRSNTYQDQVRKKLIMRNNNGSWLIVKEMSY